MSRVTQITLSQRHVPPFLLEAFRLAEAGHRDQALARIRAGLRERMLASPLCDAQRFAREMEAAYRWMWGQWCGQPIKNQESKI